MFIFSCQVFYHVCTAHTHRRTSWRAVGAADPKKWKNECFWAKDWRNSGKYKSHEVFFNNLFFWIIKLVISEMNIIDF